MTEFTWEIYNGQPREHRRKTNVGICVVDSRDPVAVAYGNDLDEARKHARLIAAAPDLLAALEGIAECAPETVGSATVGSWQFVARAAIAKAKGQ